MPSPEKMALHLTSATPQSHYDFVFDPGGILTVAFTSAVRRLLETASYVFLDFRSRSPISVTSVPVLAASVRLVSGGGSPLCGGGVPGSTSGWPWVPQSSGAGHTRSSPPPSTSLLLASSSPSGTFRLQWVPPRTPSPPPWLPWVLWSNGDHILRVQLGLGESLKENCRLGLSDVLGFVITWTLFPKRKWAEGKVEYFLFRSMIFGSLLLCLRKIVMLDIGMTLLMLFFQLYPILQFAYVITSHAIAEAREEEEVIHIKDLGASDFGQCKVDETPKGWFITYIDRDSETLFKERMKNKRIKADMADEEKQEKEIRKQIEKAEQLMQLPTTESDQPSQVEHPMELNVEDGVKIGFSLGTSAKHVTKEKHEASRVVFDEVEEENYEERNPRNNLKRKENVGGKSTLDELMRDEEKEKGKN